MPGLKHSKSGWVAAGLFTALAVVALLSHLYSILTRPGDSGESAVVMIPFAIPWIFWIPDALVQSRFWKVLAYPVFGALVLLNAFLLYCVFGGLRGRSGGGEGG